MIVFPLKQERKTKFKQQDSYARVNILVVTSWFGSMYLGSKKPVVVAGNAEPGAKVTVSITVITS